MVLQSPLSPYFFGKCIFNHRLSRQERNLWGHRMRTIVHAVESPVSIAHLHDDGVIGKNTKSGLLTCEQALFK